MEINNINFGRHQFYKSATPDELNKFEELLDKAVHTKEQQSKLDFSKQATDIVDNVRNRLNIYA